MEDLPGRLRSGESMNDTLQMLKDTRAFACVECGKCSAACVMASMYADFSLRGSPRGFVRQALRQGKAESASDLRRCLQCGNCTAVCPEGVDVAACIAALRELCAGEEAGLDRFCPRCGRELMPLPARQWLEARFPVQAEEEDAAPGPAFSSLCPACRRLAYAHANTVG
jgi:Fe-S oxidoreductase